MLYGKTNDLSESLSKYKLGSDSNFLHKLTKGIFKVSSMIDWHIYDYKSFDGSFIVTTSFHCLSLKALLH